MAFVAEDGTGIVEANAYGTVSEFMTYWADRGQDLSDLEGEAVQAALIRATDYMELRFASKWKGIRMFVEQGLSFPRKRIFSREGVEYSNVAVPKKVKAACFEYTKRALDAALLPDPTLNSNIISQTETIGPISTSTTYAGGANATKIQPYPSADMLLSEFITDGVGTYR